MRPFSTGVKCRLTGLKGPGAESVPVGAAGPCSVFAGRIHRGNSILIVLDRQYWSWL